MTPISCLLERTRPCTAQLCSATCPEGKRPGSALRDPTPTKTSKRPFSTPRGTHRIRIQQLLSLKSFYLDLQLPLKTRGHLRGGNEEQGGQGEEPPQEDLNGHRGLSGRLGAEGREADQLQASTVISVEFSPAGCYKKAYMN